VLSSGYRLEAQVLENKQPTRCFVNQGLRKEKTMLYDFIFVGAVTLPHNSRYIGDADSFFHTTIPAGRETIQNKENRSTWRIKDEVLG
jgi:hypothetical protein